MNWVDLMSLIKRKCLSLSVLLGLSLSLIGGGNVWAQSTDPASSLTQAEIEQIVRDYLLNNPDVVMQAIQNFEAMQEENQRRQRAEAMAALDAQIYENPMTPDNGVTDGDVTLVEFFDYQCGYCKRLFPTMMDVMEDDRKLRVVFKELPILGPVSTFAAQAALAAKKQGKYQEFHAEIMDLRGRLSQEKVLNTASSLGLDIVQLQKDMQDPEIQSYLQANLQLAQRLGVTGTPAMLIGRQFVPGAVGKEQLLELIQNARNTAG